MKGWIIWKKKQSSLTKQNLCRTAKFLQKIFKTGAIRDYSFKSHRDKGNLLPSINFAFWVSFSNIQQGPWGKGFSSVQFSCWVMPTLCDPMNRSTPGLPVHHQLSEFTQTHVHRVGDAIQPSHPLSSPSPPAPDPSQHQSIFQWVNSSHQVAKVLEFQL